MDPADGASPQRRAFPRIPLRAKARMEFAEQRYFLSEWAVNLSPGGMFVRSEAPMTAGQRFHFEASLTPRGPVFSGVGEVTWVRHDWEGGARPPGFAVRFLEIDEQGRATMIQLAQTFIEKGAAAMQEELRAMATEWYQRLLAEERAEAGEAPAPFPDTDEVGRPWPEASDTDSAEPHAAEPRAAATATDEDDVDIELADTDPGLTPRTDTMPAESGPADTPATPPRKRVWWLGVVALFVGGGVVASLAWLPTHGSTVAAATHAAPLRVDARPAVPPRAPPAASPLAAAIPFGGLERVSWNDAEAGGLWVVLELDGALPSDGLRRFRPAAGPPREVIQLLGARRGYEPSVLQVHSPLLEQIRVGFHPGDGDELPDELRVVLDLPTAAVAVRRVEREGSAVRILLADVADDQTTATTSKLARASMNALPVDRPANQAASALAAVPASTVPQ